MTRRLAAFVLGALLLSACGAQSPAQAMRSWVTQSAFAATVSTMRLDARQAVAQLRDAAAVPNVLHTVCGVLSVDALSANSALPTPDDQATALLGRAYGAFGTAAQLCYRAAGSDIMRRRAIAELERAVATLAEARARVSAAS